MTAQVAPAPAGELHPISIRLDADFTESTCAVCGPLERTSTVSHAADHAMVTGHTVTERHVTVSTVRECA
jgi:hypothetical protein